MAQPTQQDEALNAALSLVSLAAQFVSLRDQAVTLSARFTANSYLSVLNAQPTAPWAADGLPGTPDVTPVTANPITTASLGLAANDVTGGVYMLNDFIAFMSNGAVSASDRNATIAKLVR
jgi:hypothetical protein